MKLLVPCTKCVFDGKISPTNPPTFYLVDYENKICEFECDNKHKNRIFVQNESFELLYDSAIIAYCDGYNRECVLNIASALECFYEYAIGLIIYSKSGDYTDVTKFLKNIKKRSECREGAFYGICKATFNENLIIEEKMKNFRNDVIHNGKFPSKDDTIKYAECAFDLITSFFKLVKDNINEELFKEYNFVNRIENTKEREKKNNIEEVFIVDNNQCVTVTIPTIISQSRENPSFDNQIEALRKNMEYYYGTKISGNKKELNH